MKRTLFQRVLLALIPVGLLTTASLAFSVLHTQSIQPVATPIVEEAAAPTPSTESAPPRYTSSTNVESPTLTAQNQQAGDPEQIAQAQAEEQHRKTMTEIQQMAEEPMPELVVDKTPLTQAMTELGRSIEQAKLAVTSLDAHSQSRHIQESLNFLAGYKDPAFNTTPLTVKAEDYKGVSPLLVEARVIREAAEVQWVAAVQQRLEARSKRLAELAQAGDANGTITQQQTQTNTELAQVVGPTGVLGTRGVRPEEQANELVRRAIRQAAEALRQIPSYGPNPTGNQDNDGMQANASDQATSVMESVVRTLETAMKIIQIAANR